MDAKAREIDIIIRKLEMETRNSGDMHAWLVYEGVTVVRTKRSFGKGKYVPADKIRCQLKVNENQFAGLIDCHFSKQDYIKHLILKGIIVPKQNAPEPSEKKDAPKPSEKSGKKD
jgi:hypothetical protein